MSSAPLRRFAARGDLHAEDERLAHVLTWLSGQHIGAVLSVSDIVDGTGDLDRRCALLTAHRALVVRQLALLEEARADWQWSRRAADGWRQYLVEIVLVVEEASLEEERLRARYFFLLLKFESELEMEKPDP